MPDDASSGRQPAAGDDEPRSRPIRWLDAGRNVARQSMRDDVLGLGAELAYRFFLAIFPFAIFLTALGGFIADQLAIEDPSQRAVELLGDALPQEAASLVQGQLQQVIENQNAGLLSFSALAALFFATGGTNAIIKAMNRAYGVEEGRPIWKRYILAILLTLFAGASIVLAFVLFVPLRILLPNLLDGLELGEVGTLAANGVIVVLALALVVAAAAVIYRVTPNIKLPMRSVLPGAVIFAVVWLLATLGFSFYVANFGNYANTYGALAGVAIMLIWFYVSSLVLLVSAEVNEVIHEMSDPEDMKARQRESREETAKKKDAVAVTREPTEADVAEDDADRGATA
jgi:membrane protein